MRAVAARPAPAPRSDVVGVTGVTLDSRAVRPGDLYAALPGARVHGAAFAADVRDRGAVAVLTDPEGAALLARAGVAVPAVVVPRPARGPRRASPRSSTARPAEHLRMLGITGTNGKTTTTYLLDAALRALGHVTGLVGTVETRLGGRAGQERAHHAGGAGPARAARRDARAGRRHLHDGGLQPRPRRCTGSTPVVFDVAAFTNLSQDHLDFHGDDGGLLRRQGRPVHPAARRAAASSASTTRGAGGWRPRRPCPWSP